MLVLQFYIKKGKKNEKDGHTHTQKEKQNGGKEAYEIDLYIHYHKKTKLTEAG